MKLTELSQKGTYAAVRVKEPGNSSITEFIKQHNIPIRSSDKEARRHVTLLYSHNYLPVYKPDPTIEHVVKVVGYELFDARPGVSNEKCLVMLLSAPTLLARHATLMAEHPATFDYPRYTPHITLSYNIPNGFDVGTLPVFADELILGNEYSEELDTK